MWWYKTWASNMNALLYTDADNVRRVERSAPGCSRWAGRCRRTSSAPPIRRLQPRRTCSMTSLWRQRRSPAAAAAAADVVVTAVAGKLSLESRDVWRRRCRCCLHRSRCCLLSTNMSVISYLQQWLKWRGVQGGRRWAPSSRFLAPSPILVFISFTWKPIMVRWKCTRLHHFHR